MGKSKNILITGGCGFIASQVVRDFSSKESKSHVVVFDALKYSGFSEHIYGLPNVTLIKGDLANKEQLEDCFKQFDGFDAVIHAAAESSVDKSIKVYKDFILSNILGTANLFELCLQYDVPKIINFGTDEVYGHLELEDSSFTEDTPLQPRNIYSASKASQVLFANAFHKTFQLPVINVCPSNCYGPRQLPEKLLPRMIYLLEKGEPLPVYGNGQNIREWLFVGDVSKAIHTIYKKGVIGETYNIGSGNEMSNIAILELLASKLEKDLSINFVSDRKGHDFRYSVNYDKLKLLGLPKQTPLDEGLDQTISWYKRNWSWLEVQYKKVWS